MWEEGSIFCGFVLKEGTGKNGMMMVPLGKGFDPLNQLHLEELGGILDKLEEQRKAGTLVINNSKVLN